MHWQSAIHEGHRVVTRCPAVFTLYEVLSALGGSRDFGCEVGFFLLDAFAEQQTGHAGNLDRRADGLFSFARLEREGVSSMDLDLVPKSGVFADGPYRLDLFMNDIHVAVLNWSIGRGTEP